jgi:transcriptional regulator of acetoin/glycerol metabolism
MQRIDLPEQTVRQALRDGGSVSAAAVLLGISRVTLYRLMTRYGIEIKRIVA